MGDGLMATFGAPVNDPEHSQNAFNAGIDILHAVSKLVHSGVLELKIGMGLIGSVVMGNIGNELRKQFSLSGEAVVIAARLEQATKSLKCNFIISKEISALVDLKNVQLRALGCVKMKNISKKIEAFGVKIA